MAANNNNSPGAIDFFLNIWSQRMSGENEIKPGSVEWARSKSKMLRDWAQVWVDCVELAKFIEAGDALGEEVSGLVKPAENKIEVELEENEDAVTDPVPDPTPPRRPPARRAEERLPEEGQLPPEAG